MAKVTGPLNSVEAYGQFGKAIIYQGTWAKEYKVPRDPKTGDQVESRGVFFDGTKTLKALGDYGRAALKTNFGPRWWSLVYGFWRGDELGKRTEAEGLWDGFSGSQKTAWNQAAPFQETSGEPGLTFYSLARECFFMSEQFKGGFGLYDYLGDDSADAAEWWGRGLEGVPTPGLFDNDGGVIAWSLGIDLVSDGNAMGGSYLRHAANAEQIAGELIFYGRGLKIIYKQDLSAGTWRIQIDGGTPSFLNQSALPLTWQKTWLSETLGLGLHVMDMQRIADGELNLDGFEIL